MRASILTIFAWTLASSLALAQEPDILFDGIGKHGRRITTGSRDAQRYFNQGLSQLYGFNHDEAIRSFKAATARDPQCAMAWWGLAMANGPHVNNSYVPPEREKEAYKALRTALFHSYYTSPVERALIMAAMERFAYPQVDRKPLDLAYANAMREVWQRFPTDADVGAMFAESLMGLQPWDYWDANGKPKGNTVEITDTIAKVMALNSHHPQALHLAIHAWEASPTPEKAERAADRLRNLQPGLGHMVHMPSHIDVRLGNWAKAVVSNEKAMLADRNYTSKRPRQGFYQLYMGHNRHMLAHAAMMRGQSKKAIAAMDEMAERMKAEMSPEMAPMFDGYLAMPLEVRIRFGKWDEILAMPDFEDRFPLARTLRHMARGVAFAAKGDVTQALVEEALYLAAAKRLTPQSAIGFNSATALTAVATPLLRGEILVAQGEIAQGIELLTKAVAAEDQLTYDEPPDWINPTRHPLGAALMRAGKYAEAEAVYREDLRRLPNNGWSLYGLSQALAKQGKDAEEARFDSRFKEIWAEADTEITSSCMCLP